ncbi:MAG: hypothetical protein HQK49_10160 [Oligoflexia bacterium]|nr:hypothetical protein [Oligoflexia bacterium]
MKQEQKIRVNKLYFKSFQFLFLFVVTVIANISFTTIQICYSSEEDIWNSKLNKIEKMSTQLNDEMTKLLKEQEEMIEEFKRWKQQKNVNANANTDTDTDNTNSACGNKRKETKTLTKPLKGIYTLLNKEPTELETMLEKKIISCENLKSYLYKGNNGKKLSTMQEVDLSLVYGKCVAQTTANIKGLFKPQCGEVAGKEMSTDGRSFLHERAAFVVDQMIDANLIPPTVLQYSSIDDPDDFYFNKNEVKGSLQYWFENTTSARKLKKSKMSMDLTLLDFVIGNCDRHVGNILFDKSNTKQEIAIDNGLSFDEAYCKFARIMRSQDSDPMNRLNKLLAGNKSQDQAKQIREKVTKIVMSFNPASSNYNQKLCDELKYNLLDNDERYELNKRLDTLQSLIFGKQKKIVSTYCTSDKNMKKESTAKFSVDDCFEQKIIREKKKKKKEKQNISQKNLSPIFSQYSPNL